MLHLHLIHFLMPLQVLNYLCLTTLTSILILKIIRNKSLYHYLSKMFCIISSISTIFIFVWKLSLFFSNLWRWIFVLPGLQLITLINTKGIEVCFHYLGRQRAVKRSTVITGFLHLKTQFLMTDILLYIPDCWYCLSTAR